MPAHDKSSGWAPAIGMFLGHYLAWICAAMLLAAQIKLSQDATANPGALAWGEIGWTGIVCVVIAGWTTANPTIYRAGLAFQGIFPGSKRFTMTLVAGLVATIAGVFPNLSGKLLDFVGTYGTVLGPMGAIIFVDFWLMKRFGLRDEAAHVVTLNDELLAITREIVANNVEDRVHVGLDFLDASINRVAAWTIGVRNTLRGLLIGLLEPTTQLREAELNGDYTTRLALQEEAKTYPIDAVWDEFCRRNDTPVGTAWLEEVCSYERDVLSLRD